ncbi:MAG: NUDIX domain-containing protein [Candidatus Saccharimonas sp.]
MPHLHTGPRETDFTVTGYVVHDERVLMQIHRKHGIWLAPGGHVEWDQTPVEALYDELEQEAGIPRSALALIATNSLQGFILRKKSEGVPTPFDIDVHHIPATEAPTHRHIDMAYALRSETDDVKPAPGESQTWEWMDVIRLDSLAMTLDPVTHARAQIAIRLAGGAA